MNLGRQLRVACVGLGIGKTHLKHYATRSDVDIVAVCDVDENIVQREAAIYNARAYTSFDEMLARESLDAVSICTPPRWHAPMTEACADAGVHVLCEKPMAGTLEDCQRMVDAAERSNIVLMIAHKKRFHAFYAYLKRMTERDWGPILWASVHFGLGRVDKDWFWEESDGGGPLVENSIHVFDLLRWLMGEPKRIAGFGGNLFMKHRAPQIDAAVVCVEFESGGVASMALGYGSEWAVAREHLAFATPTVVVDADGPFDRPQHFTACKRTQPPETFALDFPADADWTGFATEIDHFIQCVRNNARPICDGREGMEAVKFALAAKHAIRTRSIVEMSGFEMA